MKTETVTTIAGYVFPIGLLALFATPAIWAYQILHWLRWGYWQGISLVEGLQWAGLTRPQFTWGGVQKVSDFLMAMPLALVWALLVMGVLVGFSEWADHNANKQPADVAGEAQ